MICNMLIKLLLIATVLVVGAIVFQTQLQTILPNTVSTIPDTIREDVDAITSRIEEQASDALDTITEEVLNTTADIIQP